MCNSFPKDRRFSFWLIIVIAIVTANISAAEPASGPRFVVERLGEGRFRPVVFIPGLASAGNVFDAAATKFASDHDIHIVTLAGFAGVPAVDPVSPYIEQAVGALTNYLDSQQLQDVVLVGHSLGAQISLQLAAVRPDVVSRVLVIDSAPFYAALFNPGVTPEAASNYGAQLGAQMAAAPREQFLEFARQGLAVQSITELGQQRVMESMSKSNQMAVAQAMADVAGSDYRPILTKVSAPVTVVAAWSEGTPYSVENLRAIYEGQYDQLANADINIIANSRHFIMLDQPDAFAALLGRVLTKSHGETKL